MQDQSRNRRQKSSSQGVVIGYVAMWLTILATGLVYMYIYAVPVEVEVEENHPCRLLLIGISDSPYNLKSVFCRTLIIYRVNVYFNNLLTYDRVPVRPLSFLYMVHINTKCCVQQLLILSIGISYTR